MSDNAAIVLQARMGSRRLPGKALALVAGRPVLEHCIERLQASAIPMILATTTREEDDPVAQHGQRLGVEVVRGPDDDVLGRFVLVATRFGLTEVVRATADNPAVDMDAPLRVLDVLRSTRADHVTETNLPYGTAVEAISVTALLRAVSLTGEPQDREHVTLFLTRDARFVSVRAPAPTFISRPGLRLTVDTADDLQFVRDVFKTAEQWHPRPVPLVALIAAAERLTGMVPVPG